jgi:hypothetical protein
MSKSHSNGLFSVRKPIGRLCDCCGVNKPNKAYYNDNMKVCTKCINTAKDKRNNKQTLGEQLNSIASILSKAFDGNKNIEIFKGYNETLPDCMSINTKIK